MSTKPGPETDDIKPATVSSVGKSKRFPTQESSLAKKTVISDPIPFHDHLQLMKHAQSGLPDLPNAKKLDSTMIFSATVDSSPVAQNKGGLTEPLSEPLSDFDFE